VRHGGRSSVWPPWYDRAVSRQERLPLARSSAEGTTLEGTLERVTFANEANAWSVVKLAVDGRAEQVTAVGPLLGVKPGEHLRLRGRWARDPRYGEQFQIDSFDIVLPASLTGIERYLGSGMVRGIGRGLAERVVRHFGLETLDIIDKQPERLAEVEGIGPVRLEQLRVAWAEQRAIKDVMVFLQSHDVATGHAIKIYKRYGDRAIAVVRENPYRLAREIFGIGFHTADGIARRLGVEPTSTERIRAGLLHALGALAEEGNVGAKDADLVSRTAALLEVDAALVESAILPLAAEGEINVESLPEGRAVYLRSLYTAEVGIAELAHRLRDTPAVPMAIDVDKAIDWFERGQGITLAEEQRRAVRWAIEQKVLVVTGGPGTGKTTLINAVIRILEKKVRAIVLAAPTGRAAKRMAETTGHEAKTLHRLLEWNPQSGTFVRDPKNPLEAEVIIVDEASMLDTLLAFHLLRALPTHCKLILVGDVDQLPSVGPGSVLLDFIRSGAVAVARLAHIFRQAEKSHIVVNAHRINAGEMPLFAAAGDPASDFFFIEKNEPEEILAAVKTLLGERIPRKFGMNARTDIQVLTPMNRGLLGAMSLNTELQALLNPGGAEVTRGARTFREGDKVMQIRNNYDLDVFNGDIGQITAIDEAERSLTAVFDGRTVRFEEENLDELTLAYACSVHKAQGSEYPCVVLPLHTQHYVMLKRNLLYTAVTRGRKLVVVVGSRRALSTAVRNGQVDARFSGLARRLAAN
jgi:exodeoxyribonuclease V alpha subunit